MRRLSSLLCAVSLAALAPALAWAEAPAADAPAADNSSTSVQEVVVTAKRLDAARQTIEPALGSSEYTLTKEAIQALPAGDNSTLNQVVLQMPGVVQDSFGQLHIRDDHANIQFRIDNVILPEGLNVFGQALTPRFAQNVDLVTGALPAQYGLLTAGIVNITTKSGFDNESQVSLYGGSHDWIEPSFQLSGSSGANNWFLTGSYTANDLGIESPDGSANPHHDRTEQYQAFGFFDHIVDPQSRVSVMGGISDENFQIPQAVGNHSNAIGFTDGNGNPLTVNGVSDYLSQNLNESQREVTDYGIVTYEHTTDAFTGQLSLFGRYSTLNFQPDVLGDLLFNGISQAARKTDAAFGVQAEGVYHLSERHTLRFGAIVQFDHSTSDTASEVLPVDVNGVPTTDVPETIVDNGSRNAQSYSAYLQDEWKPFDRLTINYGLRFDQVNALRDENQLSPRINFVWTPTDTTTVHGGYARYFTPPPFELVASEDVVKFLGTTAQPAVLQDTTPYADRENYFDLGVQQKVGSHLTLGVDGYLRRDKNLIDEGQFGAPIILTPFNYARGKIQGVEFSATYNAGPFSAYANFAETKGQGENIVSSQFNFDPGDLAYIQNHYIYLDHDEHYSASLGATYRFEGSKVGFDAIYGSGLRADGAVPNGDELPGYWQVNATAQHRFNWAGMGGPLDVRFDVINLFDKKYEIRDGTGVGVGAPQWGPRRGFFVGVTKTF
jgi:outer membrane receptor protein involved in Fe transport